MSAAGKDVGAKVGAGMRVESRELEKGGNARSKKRGLKFLNLTF